MVWVSVTILFYFLLDTNSPVYIVNFLPYLNVDLSFLIAPFTVLFILLFVASSSSMLITKRPWTALTPKMMYGLTISTFIFVFFHWTPIPPFAIAILFPLELTIIVFTGSLIAADLLKHRQRFDLMLIVLCTGTVAYALYDIARVLSLVYEPIVHAVLPFTLGLLTACVGALFGFFVNTDKIVISKISEWIYKGPLRNFMLGFFTTIYVNSVRPSVEDFPPIIIGEWITIAVVMAVILNATKESPKALPTDSKFTDWKRHTREAQRQTGRAFEKLVAAQEKFLIHGIKEPLLVYLTLTLHDLGETEERIPITLAPLMTYHARKPPFWNLPWTKRKVAEQNKEARRKLLESLVQKLERVG